MAAAAARLELAHSMANTMVGNTVDGALSKVGSNTVSSCVGN